MDLITETLRSIFPLKTTVYLLFAIVILYYPQYTFGSSTRISKNCPSRPNLSRPNP